MYTYYNKREEWGCWFSYLENDDSLTSHYGLITGCSKEELQYRINAWLDCGLIPYSIDDCCVYYRQFIPSTFKYNISKLYDVNIIEKDI
jgi:hypothetical protein